MPSRSRVNVQVNLDVFGDLPSLALELVDELLGLVAVGVGLRRVLEVQLVVVDRLAILALTLYALLPVVRNTYTGIAGVDAPVREAAIGMGLTSRQLLWQGRSPVCAGDHS